MFSKRIPVLFISRHFVDPGLVILSHTPSFEGGEALSYTPETLVETLANIPFIQGKNIRIVLSEELVYVTTLDFPAGTKLNREVVCERAQELIPEDMQATEWDFRQLHSVKVSDTSSGIVVQVAVIERAIGETLERALLKNMFTVAGILPESCVLAAFEAGREGMSVIVAYDREGGLLIAADQGSVLATEVAVGDIVAADIEKFLAFVSLRTSKKTERIIFSRSPDAELPDVFREKGFTCEEQSYNPLLGAALEKISGRDESVMNLATFFDDAKRPWWKKILKK